MEHGLLWLPLLAMFFWLAWQGSKEYQKVEAYRAWAEQFERAKYDIYAVLGQKDNNITWGKPTPKGPIKLETFSLDDVQTINLLVDDKLSNLESPPEKGRQIELEFLFPEPAKSVKVPFTEIPLAAEWGKYLQSKLGTK
ncbi:MULTISPECIES: hypothetical protein [unclassified Tolypothrix]|uniref:hypothetical protein n=1 Tax=unclassified Tolypothrix TaxID=2649714 RepID=UPI0005EAC178|nr:MULTISPECIES: hypothetical protein [unclassified Tolypothrix]BAY94047.1 hypothetical protein NIES3275_60920 [Microchaete diplosiphon NIES-3275]EKF03630.1 hypothetical protein FDUTEX481_02327 [Tolypothrix sp. PCC 7601]MBE9081828.1 hypothetical protein [Tolypothrix sp. LEGE 11397]UYD27817.1 hypothetical protein HGR01_07070 [Tolypothrix sp. PCC 7712]UYD36318.1 hypothetical protein HG267_11605 [Tolypothrix sp. PCC 7601]